MSGGPVRRVVELQETASTNDDLRALAAEGAPEGTVVVAHAQTQGRGRLGRAWQSPPGAGLYLSILFRPEEPPALLGRYALVAAIAAVDTCREAGADGAEIKWPNDVLVAGRKLAGILAELRAAPPGHELVLGFGINLAPLPASAPAGVRALAVSLAEITGRSCDRGLVARGLIAALERRIAGLRRGGWEELRETFVRYAPGVEGCRVRLAHGGPGLTRGLDPSGALRVETDGGEVLVHAGESVADWGV